ncbi:MAG: histidinol-phosphate transaminase [Anaerovibrio sp.]|uniref:histidinol-phosphate transaminase n=1 Tax=Anaerovibrio sp. TaxID=1872532 RepID=UPI0025FDE0E7|nr:histidinol-phosphate transaminase [Anaerovibrio sp.]MCR5176995.1 histidinol-phosphate transaminase [Anaerovibrio sp.]
MSKLKYRNKLADMPSYDVVERSWNIKVNANESGMNLPPLVEERVMSRLSRVAFNRYPNEDLETLMEAIGRNFGMGVENVLIGNGSSEIIEKIFYCFGGRGRKIVFPQPSFSMYHIYAKAAEAEAVPVDLSGEDYSLDVREYVNIVNDSKASLCVVCNPNNPTGNVLPIEDIEYIAAHTSCAFLVDEAYIEFYGKSAVSLLKKYPNMIVARTFSKAYGLAACRCGYMLASAPITEMIAKSFMPYHMDVLTLVTADTVFQMRDEFVPRIQMTIAERNRMGGQYGSLTGFKVFPSNTNFILVKYDRAEALNEYLVSRGIGVRSFGRARLLENTLRISMGNREENDMVFKAVEAFTKEN